MPSNIDIGAGHIAVFVDDLNAAAASLEKHDAELLTGPVEGAGEAKKGEHIWYFKTPWGAFMEILTRPQHLPYEKETNYRLFNPKDSWPEGIVSARHVDHLGLVVPNLEDAVRFFKEALGAQLLWALGPFTKTPTGVPIRSVRLAMLRFGANLNLELQEIDAEQQRKTIPGNIDLGAVHAAVFVDDLNLAAQSLRTHGATLLKGPIDTAGEVN
jgi:catechol 2,3-dioxygenase-like lactoylglutathione lyase family enzyme